MQAAQSCQSLHKFLEPGRTPFDAEVTQRPAPFNKHLLHQRLAALRNAEHGFCAITLAKVELYKTLAVVQQIGEERGCVCVRTQIEAAQVS